MSASKPPVEGKVWAATAGGTTGLIISTFLLWVLGVTFWGISTDALSATEAVAAVPAPVIGLLGLLITGACTFAGGWFAKHSPRPEGLYSPKRALVEDDASSEVSDPVINMIITNNTPSEGLAGGDTDEVAEEYPGDEQETKNV